MSALNAAVLDMQYEPTVSIETITPADAAKMLESNKENRRLRIRLVRQYARDLAQGRWTDNNDAICFTADGRLINGQHRLEAVVSSGQPMRALVARGVSDEAQHQMDAGARRTASDALQLTGHTYAPLLAAAAKTAILLTSGRMFRDTREQGVSTAEIQQFVEQHDELIAAVEHASLLRSRIDAKPTSLAVALWTTNNVDLAASALFWDHLATRANLKSGSPILALDDRLRRIRAGKIRTEQRDELFLIFKAWNYWRKGQKVTSLILPASTTKNFSVPR